MLFEAIQITKRFGQAYALKNVSFEIHQAEVVGIVGPNGAGKTTLLNVAVKNLRATSGNIIYQHGLKMNLCCGQSGFFSDMTVINNLRLYSKLIAGGTEDFSSLLDYFQITYINKLFGSLSSGMKQRVALCLGFMGNNDLIFLDEPTIHLDLDGVLLLREKINNAKSEGKSIIVTSHVLTDLEKTCDRIIFLKEGEITLSANVAELLKEHGSLEDAYVAKVKNA